MNDYNYYNNDSVAVLMDNMFKCKNEIHVVKPLLKLLHDNNAIPRANYKGINDGLQGFDTDLNEENKLYNNLVRNVQFRSNDNNEKNLVKLLADVYRKFNLSEEVLQSVILSWLVTNKEYNSSCNLINDANKLNNIMMEYSQKKHGRVMVKHGGSDESLKTMVTEMFTLFKDLEKDGANIYAVIKAKNINANKNTLIYHILKNITPEKLDTGILFDLITDVLNLKSNNSNKSFVKNNLDEVLKLLKNNIDDKTKKYEVIFTTVENLTAWNIFTEIIIDNVTKYITNNGLDVAFRTIYHTIKGTNNSKDFDSHWKNVQKIVEDLKRPLSSNIGTSLIVSIGGNNNSYVNKAVVNNMLIGGGEFLLQLSKVDFNEVSQNFILHLKQKGYNVENSDITTLDNLAKQVNEKLNEYREKVAELYLIKYLQEKMDKKIEIGSIKDYDKTKFKLTDNIITPNKDNIEKLNSSLKEFFKFYNIYKKTVNSTMNNVNKDHTEFEKLYAKYIV